jgi:hypothetical protein
MDSRRQDKFGYGNETKQDQGGEKAPHGNLDPDEMVQELRDLR